MSSVADARPAADPYAYKWFIAVGVTLASVIELIDTSIVNVALTDLSASLGASIDEVTWITVGYILASVIVLPMTGWLSQYFGRTRYFLGSIAIFTVASFFCGASHTLNELIFWRIVQGLGGGALISTSQSILFESFPRNEQTLAAAVFGIGMMVGPAIGPTLGGVIVDRYEWPWIFYINLPVGVLAFLMVSAYVKEAPYRVKPKEIDFVGIGLLAVGIGSLQFVLERGEHYDWFDSRMILALTVVSAVSLVAMVWWELRVDEPILNLRVLKDRSLASASAAAVMLGMALYGSIFAVPLLMQGILRFDAETTGWMLFPGAVGSAMAMAVIGRLGNRVDGDALALHRRHQQARLLLADLPARRGHGDDVRAALGHRHGGAARRRHAAGRGHLQPHPADRRQHRHRPADAAALPLHRREHRRAVGARERVRLRHAAADGGAHRGHARPRRRLGDGGAARGVAHRPLHPRPGHHAGLRAHLPGGGHHGAVHHPPRLPPQAPEVGDLDGRRPLSRFSSIADCHAEPRRRGDAEVARHAPPRLRVSA